jgi:ATP phosphoribosyltransferase regulatory subunit
VERQSVQAADSRPRDFLIFNNLDERGEALALARSLRKQGYIAARDIIRRDFESSLEYADRTGIKYMIVLGCKSCDEDHYQLVRVQDSALFILPKSRFFQDDFLTGLENMQENI